MANNFQINTTHSTYFVKCIIKVNFDNGVWKVPTSNYLLPTNYAFIGVIYYPESLNIGPNLSYRLTAF